MLCPRCRRVVDEIVERCECGYQFENISVAALPGWYDEYRQLIEAAFLPITIPWQQSGLPGTFENWTRLRIPISECIEKPGTFLDIGCANGFLLECLLNWTHMKGIEITPYGLDLSPQLVALARARLPQFKDNLFVGNALDWQPPLRFDYVRTSIEYVPRNMQKVFLERLLASFLNKDGALLVAQYRSSREDLSKGWIDEHLRDLGFQVKGYHAGFNERDLELCRVAIVEGNRE